MRGVAWFGVLVAFGLAPFRAAVPVAITHVTVIDVESGRRLADRTVVIEGNRVTSVRAAGSAPRTAGMRIVDGRGKYLIPGLWDFHVHTAWPGLVKQFGALYIANGITGVREMFGMRSEIRQWRDSLAAGRLTAPRLVAAGHILDGRPPIWPGSATATTAAEGRHAVDSLKADGADFIKVYSLLSRDAYFGIAEEAKRQGIPFVGHVPESVTATEASDAGQRTFEHLYGIAMGCSGKEAELRARRDSMMSTDPGARYRVNAIMAPAVRASYDPATCAALFRRLAANANWQVPTLTVLHAIAYLDDSTFTNDPRTRYLSPMLVKSWDWRSDFRLKARTPEVWAEQKRGFAQSLELVRAMHRAGVPILAGTDVLNPFCLPGFSLHDELGLLVRAGLPALAALQAATIAPARFLGATDSLGTVAAGKVADLVLLDADPLRDIANTRKVRAVIADGRLFERGRLDAMLAAVEKEVQAVPRPR